MIMNKCASLTDLIISTLQGVYAVSCRQQKAVNMIQISLTDAVIICKLHIIPASVKPICITLTFFCSRQLTVYMPCVKLCVEIIRSVLLSSKAYKNSVLQLFLRVYS